MHDHAKRTGCCSHWAGPGIFMLCRWEVKMALTLALTLTLTLTPTLTPAPTLTPTLTLGGHGAHPRAYGRVPGSRRGGTAELVVAAAAGRRRSPRRRGRKTAEDWMHLLRCADTRRWALLSLPDHSSPVNGATIQPSIYLL